MNANSSVRPTLRFSRIRASTLRHCGVRTVQRWGCRPGGTGRADGRGRSSGEEVTQLPLRQAPGQLEEQLLQGGIARGVLLPELRHGAAGDQLPPPDDGDTV